MTSLHHARDPQAADIAAAAARLTGTPEQLAERLRALLDAGPPRVASRESTEALRQRMVETRRHELEVAALRHRLAETFAEARGLQPTTAPMSRKELARRATPGGKWHRTAREWPSYLRHVAFYRGPDRRAAAMTVHVVPEEMAPDAVKAWAAGFDLAATCPDFPSWGHPGRTVLVILEPAEPIEPRAPEADPADAIHPDPAPPTAPDLDALRPADPDGVRSGFDVRGRKSAEEASGRNGLGYDPSLGTPSRTSADRSPVEPVPEIPEPVAEIDIVPAATVPAMRAIVPIDLAGVVPRDLSGDIGPDFDIVAPTELMVDDAYQRNLGPRSLDLIRRIVAGWSWSKFKPPIRARVDGVLHVIDGQHTAIGAASHGGIPVIPVVVVPVPEVASRAAAFVSHAKDRLQATPLQVHRAALVAGDEEATSLDAVCRAAGVEMLPFPPSDSVYRPRQTVAIVGIRRLIAKRGAERATEILSALAAADLAPVSGDHVRLGELLLCDDAYAEGFDAERLTAAMRGLTAKTHAEARELAIAQRLPAWRALAAVLARNSRGKAGPSRRRVGA